MAAELPVRPAVDAAALLGRAASGDDSGVLAGEPIVVVLLDDTEALRDVAAAAPTAPAVVVGVHTGTGPIPSGADVLDLVLVLEEAPRGGPGPASGGAVAVANLESALRALALGVARSPGAAVALVQLLRAGRSLSIEEAVVAESWVYSMLQAGPDHARWKADRPRRGSASIDDGDRTVEVDRAGDRLDVALVRPHVRNAVSARLRDELHAALGVALADPTVDAVHLWGIGPSFCSGGDLDEFGTAPDPVTAHLVRTSRSPALDLARCGSRVTAHVHGAAVGAGMEWAAFAGTVVARTDATFRLPELAMGLVPGAGGTASLARRIGPQRTAWAALTGDVMDASTALRWGLVDEVLDADAFAATATGAALRWRDDP